MNDQKIIAQLQNATDTMNTGKIRDKELFKVFHVLDFAKVEYKYDNWHPTGSSIEARFYCGRSSSANAVYCLLWLHGSVYANGKGSACGLGYDKTSSALADAIDNAGIVLQKVHTDGCLSNWHFGGSGETSMHTALLAIAAAMGMEKPVIVKSYA